MKTIQNTQNIKTQEDFFSYVVGKKRLLDFFEINKHYNKFVIVDNQIRFIREEEIKGRGEYIQARQEAKNNQLVELENIGGYIIRVEKTPYYNINSFLNNGIYNLNQKIQYHEKRINSLLKQGSITEKEGKNWDREEVASRKSKITQLKEVKKLPIN